MNVAWPVEKGATFRLQPAKCLPETLSEELQPCPSPQISEIGDRDTSSVRRAAVVANQPQLLGFPSNDGKLDALPVGRQEAEKQVSESDSAAVLFISPGRQACRPGHLEKSWIGGERRVKGHPGNPQRLLDPFV